MGIQGLLPLLKSIHKPCNLKRFDGQTIGVDAYGWLHRGSASCAIELAQGRPTTKFVDFAMNRVRMLLHFGVKPYLVFDGDYLPSKAKTEKERAARRTESKTLGLHLLSVGKPSQAYAELQKAVDVTPEMARQLIEELKTAKIEYVVAPYEADSQLAYLEGQGKISAILSEDSDLLVFGARCLLTKLDQYGDCIMINRDDFTACREINLTGWSDVEFRRMAIMSGCDYLAGISKMGLKTAYRLLRKHKTVERAIQAAQFEGKVRVPAKYLVAFEQAERTFLYQWVFCPVTQQLVNLTEVDPEIDIAALAYIGENVAQAIAVGVASGDLHPHTKQPIVVDFKRRGGLSTPAASLRKTKVTGLDSDGKKTPSIKQFFKRTPLQELDPNSFSYSPSQQRLHQEDRGSWSAETVPNRPVLSHSAPSASRSAPAAVRRAHTFPQSLMPSISHASKRQRLCSDTMPVGSEPATSGCVISPFFASKAPEPSPSVRKAAASRRRKQEPAFNIWSDDSIEEAMANLPEVSCRPATPRKLKTEVFADDGPPAELTVSDVQLDKVLTTPAQSERSVSAVEETPKPFDAHLSAEIAALRAKYTFSGAESLGASTGMRRDSRSLEPTPSSSKGAKKPGPYADEQCPTPNADNTPDQAALPSEPPVPQSPISATITPTEADIETPEWLAMELHVVPSTTRKSRPRFDRAYDIPPGSSLEAAHGSEDLLVPDTDAEEDCESSAGCEDSEFFAGKSLDLSRFAFAAS